MPPFCRQKLDLYTYLPTFTDDQLFLISDFLLLSGLNEPSNEIDDCRLVTQVGVPEFLIYMGMGIFNYSCEVIDKSLYF